MYLGQIKGNCAADTPYTGLGNCPKGEGPTSALLLTDKDALFPLDSEEFITKLSDYVNGAESPKIYPIKGIVGITPSGGDINAPDLGTLGGPRPSNLNALNVAYQIEGGDCLYKELAKLNKRNMRMFRVDDEGYVYGTIVVRGGEKYFAGFEVTLYATKTIPDGSNSYNLSLWAYYSRNNENEEKNLNGFEVGLQAIPDGLIGVVLKAGAVAGTATVETICGGDDITADWGEKWTKDMFVTATGVNPTTVSFNEATGALVITPTGEYRVAPASILAVGEIEGLDGAPVYATITEVIPA